MDSKHWAENIAPQDLESVILDHLGKDTEVLSHFTAQQVSYFLGFLRLTLNTISREKLPLYRTSCGRLIDHVNENENETSIAYSLYRRDATFDYRYDVNFYKDTDILVSIHVNGKAAYYDHNRADINHRGVKCPFLLAKLLLEKL